MTTTPSCATAGSSVTTVMIVLSPVRLAYAMSASFSVARNWMLSRCCSAGFSRRIVLMRSMSASSGPSSERSLTSYFS